MVIEELVFEVSQADRDAWIAADQACWTPFLARQAGFVSKQLWARRDEPDRMRAIIIWRDEASWKSIPQDHLDACDAQMGPMRRPLVCHTHDVMGPTALPAAD
ncbi:MAG: TIGR03792 family protein [Devosiaceae bacterium]|nr:TIGR03792 family protein [Devosiaceae bacterium MH13]